MPTSSIDHDIVITDKESAETFINALEESKELSEINEDMMKTEHGGWVKKLLGGNKPKVDKLLSE